MIHQPYPRSRSVRWLASGDQRRLTGSGSASEAWPRDAAMRYTNTPLRYFTWSLEVTSGYFLVRTRVYLESAVFLALHDVKYDGRDDVESLAVPDLVVPASVGEQDALQHGTVVLVVLATERTAARSM